MRRKKIGLALLATAMVAGSASAGVLYEGVGGFDFFTYNGAVNTDAWVHTQVSLANGVQTNYLHYQQPPGDQGYTTNGGNNNSIVGGALADGTYTLNEQGGNYDAGSALTTDNHYDVEQVFWHYDAATNLLNIGIVTGFDSDGYGGFFAGDLFLGLGALQSGNTSTLSYSYALGTGTDGVDRLGTNTQNSPTWSPITESQYFDVEADPYRVNGGTTVANFATVEWTENSEWNSISGATGNRHNFLTAQVNFTGVTPFLDILEGENGGSFTFHWTMGCGNDAAHQVVTIAPTLAPEPVPVPADRKSVV